MGQISLSIPATGQPDTTEDVKIQNDFTAIQNVINGNVDATNVTAALAQSAAVNQSGQTVKGAVNIAASESRTNVAYGTLPTPDQVTGIVLPSNGLLAVWYQATWQESVQAAARASLFLGANQVKAAFGNGGPGNIEASIGVGSAANANVPLASYGLGLGSLNGGSVASAYTGDVSTGQVVGDSGLGAGGACYIFAAAGTYTVSVQFKASSGSVTASNRKLWVQAISFS